MLLRPSSKKEQEKKQEKRKRRREERGEGKREEGRERGKMVDQKRRRTSHPKANGNLRL